MIFGKWCAGMLWWRNHFVSGTLYPCAGDKAIVQIDWVPTLRALDVPKT